MKRKDIDAIKTEIDRLLRRIEMMECMAGWTRYSSKPNAAGQYNHATSAKHPDDEFNPGQFTAAVRRASMDLSRALVEIRR